MAVLTATPMGLTDKNLFAYCDNNPITRKDNGGYFWDTVFDVVSLCVSIVDVINDPTDVGNWVGLVGDAVDLIPFVTGVGEVTRAVNLSRKALGAVDDAHDAAKVIDRTGDALETGWKVGDDITKATKAGNRPSWTTVRQRYWKNEEFFNGSKYSQEMRDLMKKGRAPIVDGLPMELHHPNGREGDNFWIFYPLTHNQHHFEHYGW